MPTGERAAIRTERNDRDIVLMLGEECDFVVGGGIIEPNPDSTRNRQQPPIGRIRQVSYLAFAQAQCRALR